jgi:hypothetical protein
MGGFFSKSCIPLLRVFLRKFKRFLCILEGVLGGSPMVHLGMGSHVALVWLMALSGGGMALTWLS